MTALGEWNDNIGEDPEAEPAKPAEAGPMHPNLGAFVEGYLSVAYARDVDNRTTYWCPEWWRHPEAHARLDALWRAWEHLRHDRAFGPSIWWREHADHHMLLLLSGDGPLKRCTPDRGHSHRKLPSLPSAPTPPDFWEGDDIPGTVATRSSYPPLRWKPPDISGPRQTRS